MQNSIAVNTVERKLKATRSEDVGALNWGRRGGWWWWEREDRVELVEKTMDDGSSEQVWVVATWTDGGWVRSYRLRGGGEKKLQVGWVSEANVVAARGLLFLLDEQGYDQQPLGQAEGVQ